MTYGELQTQTIKLGSAMRRLGFGKGDVMTIISPNCPEFCVVYLAGTAIGMTVSTISHNYTQSKMCSWGSVENLLSDINICIKSNYIIN